MLGKHAHALCRVWNLVLYVLSCSGFLLASCPVIPLAVSTNHKDVFVSRFNVNILFHGLNLPFCTNVQICADSWWNGGPPVLWLSPFYRNGPGACYLIHINRAKPVFQDTVHDVWLSLFSCIWSELPPPRIAAGFAFAFALKSPPLVYLCHIHLKDFIRGLFLTLFISFLLFLGSHFSLIDFSLCENSIVMQTTFMPMIHF